MKNPFKIPNMPKALPMKPFCDKEDYTWEDWRKEAKEKYPVRYFLSETIPFWWSVNIKHPIDEFLYWLKSHIFPKRRYHMLDLRQPKENLGNDSYRYGWIDSNLQILYACFNILVNFIEKEHKGNYLEWVKFQENAVQHELPDLREIWNIYEWWTIHRKVKQKEYDEALSYWSKLLGKISNKEEMKLMPQLESASNKYKKLEEELKSEETKMLTRLIELREYMWT